MQHAMTMQALERMTDFFLQQMEKNSNSIKPVGLDSRFGLIRRSKKETRQAREEKLNDMYDKCGENNEESDSSDYPPIKEGEIDEHDSEDIVEADKDKDKDEENDNETDIEDFVNVPKNKDDMKMSF